MQHIPGAIVIACTAGALVACGAESATIVPPRQTVAESAFTKGHRTFYFTGAKQIFRVPAGVYQIKVYAHGGDGDSDPPHTGDPYPAPGGYGGRVIARIPVTPHERLIVHVGGNGSSSSGGFNGGGNGSEFNVPNGLGGGGASDVRAHGDTLADRILVAGGGGGAGGDGFGYAYKGYSGGGKGGGLTAGAGSPGGYGSSEAQGGGPGTQDVGGGGGAAKSKFCPFYGYGLPGAPGTIGSGGAGGSGGLRQKYGGGGGGGGGGGYYGGGAGGAGCLQYGSATSSGGGGGGGSSYVEPSATDVHMWKGWDRTKHGLVVFDW